MKNSNGAKDDNKGKYKESGAPRPAAPRPQAPTKPAEDDKK